MKKLIVMLMVVFAAADLHSQVKTVYGDLYQRGGARHLKTTFSFGKQSVKLDARTIDEALNLLAEQGWTMEHVMPVERHPLFSFTRHKFHIIMKKECREVPDSVQSGKNDSCSEEGLDNVNKSQSDFVNTYL